MTGLLIAGRMVDPRGSAAPGWIAIDGDRVAATGRGRPPGTPDIDHDGLIAPGLVDLQVNGAAGHDALEGGDAVDAIDDALAGGGVTSWPAALPTAEDDRMPAALAAASWRPAHAIGDAPLDTGAPAGVVLLSEAGDTVRVLRLGRRLEGSRAGGG